MILLLDNHDSFVYNLDRYLQQLGQNTLVVRSDAITVDAVSRLALDAILISPGPKAPDDAGCSLEVIRRMTNRVPILGVCLGHQAIGQAFGASIVRGFAPVHGKSSRIRHDGTALFEGLPNEIQVGRYHSLVIDPATLPIDLVPTAWTADGTIMAVQHQSHKTFGVQFHPESILTPDGYKILSNFLRLAGAQPSNQLPQPDLLSLPQAFQGKG
jgi:anthranilate synthase/aminodeoxychorismate synthase-like glutamine amidotransferase